MANKFFQTSCLVSIPVFALGILDAHAHPPSNHDAWLNGGSAAPSPADPAPLPGYVASVDPSRGAPALLILPADSSPRTGTSEQAARASLHALSDHYHVANSVVRGARHRFTHDTGRGAIIVVFRQTVAGVDVVHGDVKVLLDRTQRVRAVSGTLHPAAHTASAQAFGLDANAAIAQALRDLYPENSTPAQIRSQGQGSDGWTRFELLSQNGYVFYRPARAVKVYFPRETHLIPAYRIELQTKQFDSETQVFEYVISARDGSVLARQTLTDNDTFKYRVWADNSGDHRPYDSPLLDNSPHATGIPGDPVTGFRPPKLIAIDGFNTFGDPWLPAGAVETLGNNVDAYVDHSDPQGLSEGEFRASVTAPGVFDRVYDNDAEPLATVDQSMAAITQLFYTVNWLHNYWYDSGFNEAAGNAQNDNYGRGGADGDVLHAQAQDGALEGARNNANMSTPADGESPRMQMYLATTSSGTLTVSPPEVEYRAGNANFGPTSYDVTASIVVIDDGVDPASDGCEPAIDDLAGQVVLIDRGSCTFETKITHAEQAGALGVLIINNQLGDSTVTLGADNDVADPSIPALGLSNNTGLAIRDTLPQIAHMYREYLVERDGTIDNQIVAHELGHYVQRRLLESGTVATRAMGEGWGDFIALHMSLREGDDLDGVYPFPHYGALFADPTGYFGYRRVPYSTDTTRNDLSFRHISDGEALPDSHPIETNSAPNAEVHNAGEVWATMMWDAYIALQKSYQGTKSFDDARRALTDYTVAGMILAPAMPTYTEQRDAILLAIAASEPEDYAPVAAAFAARGAGTCAVSPFRESTDLVGVVEDFGLSARGLITEVALSDSLLSCDDDGRVDVGEQGELKIKVFNAGAATLLAGATIEVVDPDPSLVFPEGSLRTLPELAAPTTYNVALPVTVASELASFQPIDLTLRLTLPNGCEEIQEHRLHSTIHADIAANSSAVDNVEPPLTTWVAGGTDGESIWARQLGTSSYHWHGVDSAGIHDTWIESPVLEVGEDAPLTIAFDHAYSFDFSDETFWDGGVIEVSIDNGTNWEDISAYADPGYPGMIDSDTNPLSMRPAFGSTNPSFPNADSVELNLGTALAGSEVKLRFRIATDAAGNAPGWYIDNIAFTGITNTPFATWVTDAGSCVEATQTDSDTDTGDVTETDTTVGPGPTETTESETDPNTDSGGVDNDEGCGCQTSTTGVPGGLMLFALLLVRRRSANSRTRRGA